MAGKENGNSLIEFLRQSSNSLIREELLNYRLFYDLKITAAKHQQYLKIYKPEVDIEGCDIIIEDSRDLTRKFQLKSRVMSATRSWRIHTSLLLPGRENSEDYGFIEVICPTYPGGFLLIDVTNEPSENEHDDSDITVSYSYTDINIISLMSMGYLERRKSSKDEAVKIIKELKSGNKTVLIKESLMLKLKSINSIFQICGFLGYHTFEYNAWQLNLIKYRYGKYRGNYKNHDLGEDNLERLEQHQKFSIKGHRDAIEELLKII